MAGSVLVDAGFLVALLARRDRHHHWAAEQAERLPPPWTTCEATLSEAFYLLGGAGYASLAELLRRGAVIVGFELRDQLDTVLAIMDKYADVPASLADASLVRMTEVAANPTLLTTDADFTIYRRKGRQTIPCITPRR